MILARRLRYANAAHNPPLLWRAERRSISRLDAAGLLIGLQPEADYGLREVRLDPGDVLLYYTDGVTEAPGMTGDRFDESPDPNSGWCLSQWSGPQGILDHLFDRLDRFVGADHHLEDDASMVVPLKVLRPSACRVCRRSATWPDKLGDWRECVMAGGVTGGTLRAWVIVSNRAFIPLSRPSMRPSDLI